jgi:hypothetical protein
MLSLNLERSSEENQANEAYILIGHYKCYALNRSVYQLFVVYDKVIPVYAIRLGSKDQF